MKRHLGTRGRRSRGIRYTQQRLEELAAMGVLATDGPDDSGLDRWRINPSLEQALDRLPESERDAAWKRACETDWVPE